MAPATSWIGDRVERLKALVSEGLSGGQIAAALGGITRNAVIGKLHRLGLHTQFKQPAAKPRKRYTSYSGSPNKPIRKAVQPPVSLVGKELPQELQDAPSDLLIPKEQRCTLMELTKHTCRWPVGEPRTDGFFFCGATVLEDRGPYCEPHSARAFVYRSNAPRPQPYYPLGNSKAHDR